MNDRNSNSSDFAKPAKFDPLGPDVQPLTREEHAELEGYGRRRTDEHATASAAAEAEIRERQKHVGGIVLITAGVLLLAAAIAVVASGPWALAFLGISAVIAGAAPSSD